MVRWRWRKQPRKQKPRDTLQTQLLTISPYLRETGELVEQAIQDAENGIPPEIVLNRLRGWKADEAIAAAAYIFKRHPDSPYRALLEAVNVPGHSSAIGTLVGALVGARAGISALPAEWVRDVERTEELEALAIETAELVVPAPNSTMPIWWPGKHPSKRRQTV